MLADQVDYVIGVDPHRDTHALALVDAANGVVLAEAQIEANTRGYEQALGLAGGHAPGLRAWAIEGTGSYGAGLAGFLSNRGERVVEVGRLRRERRPQGKTDALDAIRTARSVLGESKLATPRAAGKREALRALMLTREGAVEAKKAALCQLRALIVTCPDSLRDELAHLTRARLLTRCGRLRPMGEFAGVRIALRAVARRAQALTQEERELKREIETLVSELAPALLLEPGVGPICAADIVLAWSHHQRLHSEAAFARLAGAAPIPASSGKTIRYRLDRGGDRKLNRALHTIIINRRKNHADTIAYINKRTSQGKSIREAIRCLKRFLARRLYRLLEATPAPT